MEDIKALEQRVAELEKKITELEKKTFKYDEFFADLDESIKKLYVSIFGYLKSPNNIQVAMLVFVGIPKNWARYALADMKISF